MTQQGGLLVVGGLLSAAAALLHMACVFGGAPWYRFLGAGERMALAAERGQWQPTLVTIGIAAVLSIWSAYAFSGAGMIVKLPLLRTGLVVISAIYLLRGLLVLRPSLMHRPDLSGEFLRWSSLIVLVFGVIHAVGTWRVWNTLEGDS